MPIAKPIPTYCQVSDHQITIKFSNFVNLARRCCFAVAQIIEKSKVVQTDFIVSFGLENFSQSVYYLLWPGCGIVYEKLCTIAKHGLLNKLS